MKTIFLMRHASVSLSFENEEQDIEWLVDEVGAAECAHQRLALAGELDKIDEVAFSDATRTEQTITLMLGFDPESLIQLVYPESSMSVYDIVHRLSESAQKVLIVSHKPIIERFLEANPLLPAESPLGKEFNRIKNEGKGFPTATIIRIDHDGEWKDFPRRSSIAWIQFPNKPKLMATASLQDVLPTSAATNLAGYSQ